MGALDKRIFSGVAIMSALLLVMSAMMLLAKGGEMDTGSNRTVLYIVAASGILAIVYSIGLMRDRSSFVRTLSGILTLITSVMFLAVPFVGDNAGTLLAAASIDAAVTIVADMLALWVTHIYGAMYVAAVLAVVDIAMGILYFIGSTQAIYHAIALLAFSIWLVLSAYVIEFIKIKPVTKTRKIKKDQVFKKSEKLQAKNKKPKKNAKPRLAENALKVPKEEPKIEEPAPAAAEERPKRPVRTVELPRRSMSFKEVPRVKESKEGLKTNTPKEPIVEMKPAAPNEFMKRLVSSQNANRAKQEIPHEEPKTELEVSAEPIPEPEQAVEIVNKSVEEVYESVAENEGQSVEELEAVKIAKKDPVEKPVIEESAEVGEIALKLEVSAEKTSVEESEATKEIAEEAPEQISQEPEPESDWSMVSYDAFRSKPEDPVKSEFIPEFVKTGEVEIGTFAFQKSTEEELGEDIYTDYSPEAMVRRAAWNKGLRCRRGYGEYNIPVAFVKGKVAVYVDFAEADTSVDVQLAKEGWTVLRYDAATITDGKAQGEEIAAVIKANMRSVRATAKKKSKK